MDHSIGLEPVAFIPDWFALPEIKQFTQTMARSGIDFMFWGGAVRDAFRDQKAPKDFDIFANATAESIHAALTGSGIASEIKPSGKVIAYIGDYVLDMYTRHSSEPSENWLSPEALRDKVLNFDFSVNTLVLSPSGQLYDFFGVRNDIREGKIRFIVDPLYAIGNDGAHIAVRYFRFRAQFGDMQADEYVSEVCKIYKKHIAVPAERQKIYLLSNLAALLDMVNPLHAFQEMRDYEVLDAILGVALEGLPVLKNLLTLEAEDDTEKQNFRLAAILQASSLTPLDALEKFSEHLNLSETSREKIRVILNLVPYMQATMTREKRIGLIEALPSHVLNALLMLRASAEHAGQAKQTYLALARQFSQDGYYAPSMGRLYVAAQQGGCPYTLQQVYGFTLIEMSIVLVIVGLIVGGVLVGRDLIRASEIRATVTQIEKYNTAVNTFRGKYNFLPGDANVNEAQQNGLTSSGTALNATYPVALCTSASTGYPGDENGIIGYSGIDPSPAMNQSCSGGETLLFWQHLKDAGLFSGPVAKVVWTSAGSATSTANLPALKFSAQGTGGAAAVTVFPGITLPGLTPAANALTPFATHLFWITSYAGFGGNANGGAVMTPSYAYAIDAKIDDSFPTSGNVQATGDAVNNGPTTPSVGSTSTACVTTGQARYNFPTANTNVCGLVLRAAF
jgi:prepilin-type N-terminal cleavage/methylation domain-containing protein